MRLRFTLAAGSLGLLASLGFARANDPLPAPTRLAPDPAWPAPRLTAPARPFNHLTPLPGPAVWLTGDFVTLDGQPVASAVRLDASGQPLPTPPPPADVQSSDGGSALTATLADAPDGLLVATARNVAGALDARLRRLDLASGTFDPTLDLAAAAGSVMFPARINSLQRLADGATGVTGTFVSFGDHTTENAARLLPDGRVDPAFVSTTRFQSATFAPTGEVAGLVFDHQRWHVVRLDAAGTEVERWQLDPLGFASALPGPLAVDSSGAILVGLRGLATAQPAPAGIHRLTAPIPTPLSLLRFRAGQPTPDILVTFTETADPSDPSSSAVAINALHPRPDGTLLLVGRFPRLYSEQPYGVLRLDATGAVDPSFVAPALSASVALVELQPASDGGWWAHLLEPTGPATAARLRLLNADFTPRPAFAPALRRPALIDRLWPTANSDSVIVEGTISPPSGGPHRFARLAADGTVTLTNLPRPAPDGPGTLAVIDSSGRFYLRNALPPAFINIRPPPAPFTLQRFLADGAPDPAFAPLTLDLAVSVVELDGDGRLLIAGTPSSGTDRAPRLLRFTPDGTPDPTWSEPTLAPFFPPSAPLTAVATLFGDAPRYLVTDGLAVLALAADGTPTAFPGLGSAPQPYYFPQPIRGFVRRPGRGDQSVYAYGSFDQALGVLSPGILRLTADGLPDREWRSALPVGARVDSVHPLGLDRWLVHGQLGLTGDFTIAQRVLTTDGLLDPNAAPLPHATGHAAATLAGSVFAVSPDGTTHRYVSLPLPRLTLALEGVPSTDGDLVQLTADGDVIAPASTFAWFKDGEPIPAADAATLLLPARAPNTAGVYTVRVRTDDAEVSTSLRVRLGPPTARMINASARSWAAAGDATQILGWAVAGASADPILVRSLRGALADFGVTRPAAPGPDWQLFLDGLPTFAPFAPFPLYRGSEPLPNVLLRTGAAPVADLVANPHVLFALREGTTHAVHTTAAADGAGVVLGEVFLPWRTPSADATAPRLVNFSCRALVGSGERVLIAGFVIEGDAPLPVLIQGLGPRLAELGVAGAAGDPALTLFRGAHPLATNDDWSAAPNAAAIPAARTRAGATPLADGSRDAALLLDLAPGAYTVQLHLPPAEAAAGRIGLIEVYEASR